MADVRIQFIVARGSRPSSPRPPPLESQNTRKCPSGNASGNPCERRGFLGSLNVEIPEKPGILPVKVVLTRWKSLVRIQRRPLDLRRASRLRPRPSLMPAERTLHAMMHVYRGADRRHPHG